MRHKSLNWTIIAIVMIMAISGIVLAANGGNRYFVKSNSEMLESALTTHHEFKDGFTAELSQAEVNALKIAGIETTPVGISRITKPLPQPTLRKCVPSDTKPWGVEMVNGGSGGTGVKVAVLDTGVYTSHLDLKANIIDCKDMTGRKIVSTCTDNNGHGTHVSGTIAANGGFDGKGIIGVAPEAKIMAIKVCGPSGTCWNDDIAAGIRYAADNGANIISMSLGSSSPDNLTKSAIDYAVSKGVLVVAAAGNSGPGENTIEYPGAYANVVAVGAINSSEGVASFSSRGINDGDYIIEEREVEFGAPGVSVESTMNNGCYASWSGTSMATPHISGLAAKLWQGNAADTRAYLQGLAMLHDLNPEGDDSATGFGLPIAPN